MLHEEVRRYRGLSGDANPNTPISRIGGYLDGYERALEQESCIEDIKAEIKGLIEEYDARCERWKPSQYKSTKGIAESDVPPRNPIEIESNKWGERAEG